MLEDLTEEMEVVDLSDADADADADDEDDEDDDTEEADTTSEGDATAENGEAAQPVAADGTDSADAGEAGEDDDGEAAESGANKKKRRRRRRKKKAAPPPPELTCPPHKDFWEVWAAKFSAADFQREEDQGDTDESVEDEVVVFDEPEVAEDEPISGVSLLEEAPEEDALIRVSLNIGRRHGHKAAHVRSLLKRITGLHGKAVKDLTVRDGNSLFRMDIRHYETVVARLDGSVVEDVSLTLVHLREGDNDEDIPALRVPEPASVAEAAVEALAAVDSVLSSDDEEPATEPVEPEAAAAEPVAETKAVEPAPAVVEPEPEPAPEPVKAAPVSHDGQPVDEVAAAPDEA